MAAAFAGPLLLAVSTYYWSWPFSPTSASRGELLMPVETLPVFAAKTRDGVPFTANEMAGRWWLLVVGDGRCDLYCAADLFKARQVRLALGRERARVKTAYVNTDDRVEQSLNVVLSRHPTTQQIFADTALADRLGRHGVYIVDPNVNLILYYGHGAAAKDIKRDLRHLLKASRIG